MKREAVYDRIKSSGVIAVIRSDSREECLKLVEAAAKGGISAVEITMTVPGAVDIISHVSSAYGCNNDILIGAGTVLDSETARSCILAGARFIVSPMLSTDIIKLCNRYAVAVIPGIMTVTEAVTAMEYGCTLLKLFPADVSAPSMIRSFHGPLPAAEFIPTGGISLENTAEWIKAGAAAVGIGGALTRCGGDYTDVTEYAKKIIDAVAKARQSLLLP